HWFGTDEFGRDLLTRIMYGARIALFVGFTASFAGCTIGGLLGVISAYSGGRLDLFLERVMDVLLAFPQLILALAIASILGPAVQNVVIAICIPIIPRAARVVRATALAALENVALWHERDISHSSVERVILPDSTILLDYMLHRTANLIDTLLVYPKRMRANLESTDGLVFSGQLLLDLAEAGVLREDAYRVVQRSAMRAWKGGECFRDLVRKDRQITRRLSRKQIERAFDLKRQLRNVDKIFARVFGNSRQTTPRSAQRKSRPRRTRR
ncbi:MAG: ABC transporter permease subunit, partial [Terriglobales bacterium]